MARAGVPVEVDWRSQDAVVIGKVAKVVSFEPNLFLIISYYTL
jgi:hypothetical protein